MPRRLAVEHADPGKVALGWEIGRRFPYRPGDEHGPGRIALTGQTTLDLVDEALIAALKSGRLAAAGLDVFDGEPKIHQGYYGLSNAFLLPHMGSATTETRNAMGFKALDNLEAFLLRKQAPPDLVKAS